MSLCLLVDGLGVSSFLRNVAQQTWARPSAKVSHAWMVRDSQVMEGADSGVSAGSGRLVHWLDVKKPWKINGWLVGWLEKVGWRRLVGWMFHPESWFWRAGLDVSILKPNLGCVWPMFRGELLVLGRGTSCGQLDESFKRKKPHHLARSSWLHYRGWKSTMDPSAFAATSRIPCLFRACLTGPTFQPMTLQWPGWILCQKQEGGVVKW